jgi:DNA-binding CsgD family transcriptional regulator
MGSKLKTSGLFFGFFFLAAGLTNIAIYLMGHRQFFSVILDFRYVQSLLILSAAMFASAFVKWLAWIQPAAFLAIVPIPLLDSTVSFFGLGFFAVAVLLLFKIGFYNRHRILKAIGSIVYILLLEVVSAFSKHEELWEGLLPAFFILGFIFFLYITFRERIVVYLKEPKTKLSLDEKGLSDAEQVYIRAMVKGDNVKEISFKYGVSESTVRNSLARAYKKLDINSKSGLARIAEKYEIVK